MSNGNSKIPQTNHHVLVHNIGHHDLFCDLYSPEGAHLGWYRPTSKSMGLVGDALLESVTNKSAQLKEIEMLKGGGAYELEGAVSLRARFDHDSPYWTWSEEATRERAIAPINTYQGEHVEVRRIMTPILEGVLQGFDDEPFGRLEVLLVSAGRYEEGGKAKRESTPHAIAQLLKHTASLRSARRGMSARCVMENILINSSPHTLNASSLLPLEQRIEETALELASELGEGWRQALTLHLSVNTGTTLMVSSLTLALADWAPVMHIVNPARKLLKSTPEQPSNEYNAKTYKMESVSEWINVEYEQLDPFTQAAIDELRAWRASYLVKVPVRPKDRAKESVFFHRKGLKEVLCVVAVQDREGSKGEPGKIHYVRGINLEVSLPTGTLCAERNAIGTALCDFPQLQRADIKAVVVLSLDPKLKKLGPCGACQEWLKKVLEVNPSLQIVSFDEPEAENIYIRPALQV